MQEEPDYTLIPEAYSPLLTKFIKKMLIKDPEGWPNIKDMLAEMVPHAEKIIAVALPST